MRSAPAVGYLVRHRDDGSSQWGIKTERQIIPLEGTQGMLTSIEALEVALRTGWSFLFRSASEFYVTQNVDLLTVAFRKEENGWVAYPSTIAKKENLVFPPDTTPEQITETCANSYWYPMEDDSLTFQKLGLPISPSDTSRM